MRTSVLLLLMVFVTIGLSAQNPNVKTLPNGDFIAMTKAKQLTDSITSSKFTDSKGVVHPVYRTDKGRFFISKTSKTTGKSYRYYLVPEADLNSRVKKPQPEKKE